MPSNTGSALMRSSRSLSAPSSFTLNPAATLCCRMDSWRVCRSPPARTAAMRIVSVAMKGSSASRCRWTILGCTTMPEETLRTSWRMASAARNASGIDSRLFAESSSVRSSHCTLAVSAGLMRSDWTKREREQMRSQRIGFRLYAIADEPICSASKGSSTSFRWASSRMSFANLAADCAIPQSTATTSKSLLRVYVWPVTPQALAKPMRSVTIWSSLLTLSWSPSKRDRNDAWVPVVPLAPRNRSPSRTPQRRL
mmetsp:Transcript_19802/g.34094  ORF Transcript_19802/g.34094 Transcript_19802/m.34094 type:complete len:254 (-) Transcript_19802:762-1523(-)